MIKRKIVKNILFLSLLVPTLASCGGSSEGDGINGTLKVVFWTTFGKDITDSLAKKISTFETLVKENDGLDVEIDAEYQGSYDDISGKVIKGFAANNIPSLVVAYPDHVANYLALEKFDGQYVQNLDEYIDDPEVGFEAEEYLNPSLEGVDDFFSSYLEEGREYTKEGTYSLPFLKSTEIMLYNRAMVSSALTNMGIDMSVDKYMSSLTRSDFIAILEELNENRSTYGLNSDDAYPLYYDSDSNLFISQSYQRDIPYVSLDSNNAGELDFVNEKAKAMVQEFVDMHAEGLMTTKGTNSGEYGSNRFKAAKCAFVVGSTGGTAYSDPGVSFEVGVSKFPSYTGAIESERNKYISQGVTLAILNNPGIDSTLNERKKLYARKFLKYITNTENNLDIARNHSAGYSPVRQSCIEDSDYLARLEEGVDEGDYLALCANIINNEIQGNYFNYPAFKGSDVARDQVGAIVTQALLGNSGSSIDQLFQNAYNETIKGM
jgi:multiple sugar transport system substrate-binding protein